MCIVHVWGPDYGRNISVATCKSRNLEHPSGLILTLHPVKPSFVRVLPTCNVIFLLAKWDLSSYQTHKLKERLDIDTDKSPFFRFQFLNIAGSIAAFASAAHSDVDYFKFLGLSGFIFSFTNTLLYLFHLDEYIPLWIYVEIGFNIVWSVLYIIGSALMTSWGANYACCGCSFAAFFGFSVTLLYIVDTIFLLFKKRALGMAEDAVATANGIRPGSTAANAWTTTNSGRF